MVMFHNIAGYYQFETFHLCPKGNIYSCPAISMDIKALWAIYIMYDIRFEVQKKIILVVPHYSET